MSSHGGRSDPGGTTTRSFRHSLIVFDVRVDSGDVICRSYDERRALTETLDLNGAYVVRRRGG